MTVSQALRAAALRIDRFDAEVLLGYMLEVERGVLLLNGGRSIDVQAYELLVARRETGEPVAYITGRREFWSLDLAVTPDVLIPRPDTETLIEAALAEVVAPATILDLGTGSGALLLAALSEWPLAQGLGVDRSTAALAVAKGNAERLGFGTRAEFSSGDWAHGIDRKFDLILSNPPYVEDNAELSRDVRAHEPASALFAGPDGLDDYRRLIPQLPGVLSPGGVVIVEIGWTQTAAVLALAAEASLMGHVRRDLADRDRCIVLRRAAQGNPPPLDPVRNGG